MPDTDAHAPGTPVQVRMDDELLSALEEWRRKQTKILIQAGCGPAPPRP